jgi:hypothetical protein
MILALEAVDEILILSDVSTSSAVWAECKSGVEIEVVRVEEGPEKLSALLNLEERDALFSTVGT